LGGETVLAQLSGGKRGGSSLSLKEFFEQGEKKKSVRKEEPSLFINPEEGRATRKGGTYNYFYRGSRLLGGESGCRLLGLQGKGGT